MLCFATYLIVLIENVLSIIKLFASYVGLNLECARDNICDPSMPHVDDDAVVYSNVTVKPKQGNRWFNNLSYVHSIR